MSDARPPGESALPSLTDVWSEREILVAAEELGHVGSWGWQITTGQVWWSDETYRIAGLEPQGSLATFEAFLQCVHPDDRDEVARLVRGAVEDGAPFDARHRVERPTGEVRHVHQRGSVTRAADGTPLRMIGVTRDITDEVVLHQERDEAVRALADSEELHRLLAENAWDVVWTMEVDGRISYVSPSVERVRGITQQEAMAQTLDQIHPPDSAVQVMEYFVSLYAAMEAGTVPPIYHGEREYYRKDGSIMLGELQVIPRVNAEGTVVQILGVTRDISERRRYEEELNRIAITDLLTGVWNRRQGEKIFTADIDEARRYGHPLSLLSLDIDHFKEINDSHGHQAGDRVLIELSERLSRKLRSSDILVRWGGEEFAILMRHCALVDAVPLAEKLRLLVAAEPFPTVGTITVSIGAAELGPDDDLASWLDRADRAMYDAKSAGRNAVRARE